MHRAIQLLTSKFDLSEEEIFAYRERAALKKEIFTAYLIRKNILDEMQLLEVFSEAFHLPILPHLPVENLDNDFARKIPIQFLKKFAIMPGAFMKISNRFVNWNAFLNGR